MDLVPGLDPCNSAICRGLLRIPASYLILVTLVIRTSILPVTHASHLQCTSASHLPDISIPERLSRAPGDYKEPWRA